MNAMPDPVLLAGNTIRYTRAVLIGLLPPQDIGRVVNSGASDVRGEVSGDVEHGILASSVHRLRMDSIGRCESLVDDYLKSQLPSVVGPQIRVFDKMVEGMVCGYGAWRAGGIANHMLTRLWSIGPTQPIPPPIPHVIFKLQYVSRARRVRKFWQSRPGILAADCINGMKLEPPPVPQQTIFYALAHTSPVTVVLPERSAQDDVVTGLQVWTSPQFR